MKKKIIASFLLVVLVVGGLLARPYVAVTNDEWGFAVQVRSSIHQKFHPDPLFYWKR